MTADDGWTGRGERDAERPWRLVIAGVLLVLLEHALVGGLLGGLGYLAGVVLGRPGDYIAFFLIWGMAIGVTQLVYVVPTFAIAVIVRRTVAAGVALGGLITFLLNGACFGVMCGVMGL